MNYCTLLKREQAIVAHLEKRESDKMKDCQNIILVSLLLFGLVSAFERNETVEGKTFSTNTRWANVKNFRKKITKYSVQISRKIAFKLIPNSIFKTEKLKPAGIYQFRQSTCSGRCICSVCSEYFALVIWQNVRIQ